MVMGLGDYASDDVNPSSCSGAVAKGYGLCCFLITI